MKKVSTLKYLKPYWFYALLCSLTMVGEVLCDLFLPRHMAIIIDQGIKGNNLDIIYQHGLYMLGIAVIGGILGFLSALFGSIASRSFGNDLRIATFKKAIHFSWSETDKLTTGSIITRITNDVITMQIAVSVTIRMFVRTVMLFIGGIFFMVNINPKFGIVLLIVLPIEILIMVIFLIKITPLFNKVQVSLDGLNDVMQENVVGSRVVKAFNTEEKEKERFQKASITLSKNVLKIDKLLAVLSPLQTILLNVTVVLILYIGGREVLKDTGFTIGLASQSLTYITQILNAVMNLGNLFQMLARAGTSNRRIKEILSSDSSIKDGKLVDGINGEIEFKDVSFAYADQNYVVQNLTFKLEKGKTLGIIGETGSGKSSLVNMIPRFYDTSNGEILIDGINVKDFNLAYLRKNIGIVLQKAELFSGTILDNLRWGNNDATFEEVREACKIAQADDFIMNFKDGYDTPILEKGSSLSGGQKQRLSIARALLKKPKILIFDDATSALDLKTESELFKALKENFQDLTIIIIAQRVATIKDLDNILVLNDGIITGLDSSENLLKTNKIYQDIYSSQLSGGVNNGN